jgi:hypothetical protein
VDKIVEGLKIALVLAGSILLIMFLIPKGRQAEPPGRLVPGEPIQSATSPRTWETKGFTITSLAQYRLEAFVISTEPYWFDGGADLSPVDYAVGWGPMSDRAILGKLSVSQGGRWFRYRSRGEWPLPMEEISPHCANMHMIPADSRIERQLKSVHPADIVNLSGYLVEVHGPRGMKWRSSLTRTDTGAGSCELMWVEEVSKRRN